MEETSKGRIKDYKNIGKDPEVYFKKIACRSYK
jgi:hypothetical protein